MRNGGSVVGGGGRAKRKLEFEHHGSFPPRRVTATNEQSAATKPDPIEPHAPGIFRRTTGTVASATLPGPREDAGLRVGNLPFLTDDATPTDLPTLPRPRNNRHGGDRRRRNVFRTGSPRSGPTSASSRTCGKKSRAAFWTARTSSTLLHPVAWSRCGPFSRLGATSTLYTSEWAPYYRCVTRQALA